MKICLGGTFDTIHKGHDYLLKTAVSLGGQLVIGLTSDEFARKKRPAVKTYAERKIALQQFISSKGWTAEIVEINDVYGVATEADFEGIVVSEETLPNAHLINLRRSELGLRSLKIVTIPIIKNEKGEKISSSG